MRQSLSVGAGLALAMDRASELKRTSPKKPNIRLLTQFGDFLSGITIVARIPSRRGAELDAQIDKGVRHVPLADLDARAGDLTALVDEAFAEVLAAVEAVPPPEPRPSTAEDLHIEAYENLIATAEKVMLAAAGELIKEAPATLSTAAAAEACATAALRVAALSAVAAKIDQPELADMLRVEHQDVQRKAGSRAPGSTAH